MVFRLPSTSFDEHCTGAGQWIRTVQDPFIPPTSPLAAMHAEECGLARSPRLLE